MHIAIILTMNVIIDYIVAHKFYILVGLILLRIIWLIRKIISKYCNSKKNTCSFCKKSSKVLANRSTNSDMQSLTYPWICSGCRDTTDRCSFCKVFEPNLEISDKCGMRVFYCYSCMSEGGNCGT